jgi:hypothetical protein
VLDVLDHRVRVAVDEDDVVALVVHAGEHFERVAGDEPHPARRDAGLRERLARRVLVVDLGVDGGEGRPRGALQQPQPAHTQSGADLHHLPGVRGRRDHGELRPDGGGDRFDAVLQGVQPRGGDRLGLQREVLCELPAEL